MTARAKIAPTITRRKKRPTKLDVAMLHVGAIPLSIEIKQARRDGPEGNVVVLLRTAKARKRSATASASRRK